MTTDSGATYGASTDQDLYGSPDDTNGTTDKAKAAASTAADQGKHVAGTAKEPSVVDMVQSIPDGYRVVLSPVGGPLSQAFHLATFPTVVEVVDGRVAGVGETFAAPTVARVGA